MFRYPLILFAFCLLSAGPVYAGAAPVTRIDSGKLQGIKTGHNVEAFLGIPYAASTAGDNRWRPPMPVKPWSGVRAANQFGPSCMQPAPQEYGPWTYPYLITTGTSEDCLSVNVWTPEVNAEGLPVLVWIHGGGFVSGGSSVPLYDGTQLASHNVVVVSVNYRLGVFGFLNHPDLAKENDHSGEYGLLDQIAALTWVQQNIDKFGGDPGNVTVAGQSAGGASVTYLMSSSLSEGLFHKAIVQSGGGTRGYVAPVAGPVAQAQARSLQQHLKATSIKQMRGIETSALLAASGQMRFLPQLGNHFKSSVEHEVPVLAGVTRDEASVFTPVSTPSKAQFNHYLDTQFPAGSSSLVTLYESQGDNYARLVREIRRDIAVAAMLRTFCDKRCPDPLFMYEFVRVPPGQPEEFGSFHSSELAYVFGNLAKDIRPYTQDDYTLSETIMQYWLAYIRATEPAGEIAGWPAYSGNKTMMQFGPEQQSKVKPVMEDAKLALFEKLAGQHSPLSIVAM